jgi:iron complex transport system ATP-binding protein
MDNKKVEILSIAALEIGYSTGKKPKILLPPLSARACKSELVAVIGKNGIGKSTLLRTIIGLQPSFGGNVIINGKDLSEIPRLELAQQIGFISTEIVRVINMKVYDLVSLGRFPHTNWIGRIDENSHDIITEAINKTGIADLSDKYVSELSDGERQRAMIARVLAQDTQIMIMDEPTAFLDVKSKYEIVSLLQNLARGGKTIVFTTHDFNIAINQADKIWLILENYIVEGAPEDLILIGSFNNLFDSDIIGFNAEDGSFVFRNECRGNINIKGEGMIRHWTEKAVKRAGYLPSESDIIPCIQVASGDKKEWILKTGRCTISFESIYNLIDYLGNRNNDII